MPRESAPAKGEREDGPGSPAVCLRAGSHVERANVLIAASGNGCYLTGLINQGRVKRLGAWKAEKEQRRQRMEESPGGVCQVGAPLGAPSSCLTPIQDAH